MNEQEVVPELQALRAKIPKEHFWLARRLNGHGGALMPDNTQIGSLANWQKNESWRDNLLGFSSTERGFILSNIGYVAAAITRGEPIFKDGSLGEFRDLPIEELVSIKRLGLIRIGFLKISFNREGLLEASPSKDTPKEARDALSDAYRFALHNPQKIDEISRKFQELRRYYTVLEAGLGDAKTFSDASWILAQILKFADNTVSLEVLDIIERNIGVIADRTARFRPKNTNYAYELLEGLASKGNPSQQHLGMTVLGSNLDRLGRVVSEHSSRAPVLALCEVVTHKSEEETDKLLSSAARAMVIERLKQGSAIHPEAIPANGSFLSRLLERDSTLDGFVVTQALPIFLERYGLGEETIKAWVDSDRSPAKTDGTPAWVNQASRNLTVMGAIERNTPGISAYMAREYGILDFGRYSQYTLNRQYQDRSETNLPYGIAVFPRDDHNGAFYQNLILIQNLAVQLNGAYHLRIVEVDNVVDFGRKIEHLVRRYRQAISFALIGGHGNTDSITFGRPNKLFPNIHQLTSEGLRSLPALRDYFVEHPTIILNSCLTGTQGGIAERLAQDLRAKIMAPKGSIGLKSLKVEIVDGRPVFQAEYYQADTLSTFDGTKSKPSENRSQRWWNRLIRF